MNVVMRDLRDHMRALIRGEVTAFQLRPLCPLWFNSYEQCRSIK